MAEQYTPTTEEVRNAFSQTTVWIPRTSFKDYGEVFDRWLAAHDAQAAADALRTASGRYINEVVRKPGGPTPVNWLRAEADRIAGGTSHE